MARITIVRSYEWYNQQKVTHIFIDGERVGHVGIDQTEQFDVRPGKHKIELKQRWWSGGSKALEVDLNNKEDITIKMRSFKYNWLLFLILFPFIISIYQTLINFDSFIVKFIGNLLVAELVYLVIYILFLRTRFIKMEEVGGNQLPII